MAEKKPRVVKPMDRSLDPYRAAGEMAAVKEIRAAREREQKLSKGVAGRLR